MNIFKRQYHDILDSINDKERDEKQFSDIVTLLTGVSPEQGRKVGFKIKTKSYVLEVQFGKWVVSDLGQPYIPKPINVSEVIQEIKDVLNGEKPFKLGWQERDNKESIHPRMDKELIGSEYVSARITCNSDGEHILSGTQKDGTAYMIHLDKSGWCHLCSAINQLKNHGEK